MKTRQKGKQVEDLMICLRIIFVIFALGLITFLFSKASGSLKFSKLNMISILYYYVLAFNLIGASLIYIGFRQHYLIKKVEAESTLYFTYYALVYAMIMFPTVLIIMKKLMSHLSSKVDTNNYIKAGVYYSTKMYLLQGFVLILVLICTLATIYVFSKLGYNPIVSMFQQDDINALRQSGSRFFNGNQYVKNLLMLTLTPFVSYLTYIYYRLTKSIFWKILFFYMALLSVIALTYDFSKSPIITYLLGIYLIEVIMGYIQNNETFHRLVTAGAIIILFFYVVMMDAGNSLFSIYSGPLGRIIFTQIATLYLHFEAFPSYHPFLHGASFNSWMSFIFPTAEGLRSGRVVMTIYNAEGIESNVAGVMNTVFIGEAYANFGIAGIIVVPIIFGIVIGLFAYFLPCLKKTPVTILFYVQMTLQFVSIVEGGFVDIFYSASTLFLLMLTFIISLVASPQQRYREISLGTKYL